MYVQCDIRNMSRPELKLIPNHGYSCDHSSASVHSEAPSGCDRSSAACWSSASGDWVRLRCANRPSAPHSVRQCSAQSLRSNGSPLWQTSWGYCCVCVCSFSITVGLLSLQSRLYIWVVPNEFVRSLARSFRFCGLTWLRIQYLQRCLISTFILAYVWPLSCKQLGLIRCVLLKRVSNRLAYDQAFICWPCNPNARRNAMHFQPKFVIQRFRLFCLFPIGCCLDVYP